MPTMRRWRRRRRFGRDGADHAHGALRPWAAGNRGREGTGHCQGAEDGAALLPLRDARRPAHRTRRAGRRLARGCRRRGRPTRRRATVSAGTIMTSSSRRWADGSIPQDRIFEGGPGLEWEMDVAWVIRGGADPLAWIETYKDRITAAHVKDIAPAGENTTRTAGRTWVTARSTGSDHGRAAQDRGQALRHGTRQPEGRCAVRYRSIASAKASEE